MHVCKIILQSMNLMMFSVHVVKKNARSQQEIDSLDFQKHCVLFFKDLCLTIGSQKSLRLN